MASSPVPVSCGAGTPARVPVANRQSARTGMSALPIPDVTTAPAALPPAN
jgi:hypothetical protein